MASNRKRAADDALAGDAKARKWLVKWLLGLECRPLTMLAAEEIRGDPATVVDAEIASCCEELDDKQREARTRRILNQAAFL